MKTEHETAHDDFVYCVAGYTLLYFIAAFFGALIA